MESLYATKLQGKHLPLAPPAYCRLLAAACVLPQSPPAFPAPIHCVC